MAGIETTVDLTSSKATEARVVDTPVEVARTCEPGNVVRADQSGSDADSMSNSAVARVFIATPGLAGPAPVAPTRLVLPRPGLRVDADLDGPADVDAVDPGAPSDAPVEDPVDPESVGEAEATAEPVTIA